MNNKERRIQLGQLLASIPGVERAYFQAPSNTRMKYPCIRYSIDASEDFHADDSNYVVARRYQVVVIDKDPDTEIPWTLLKMFNQCSLDRTYTADNLNHYVFTLYY